ncbi:CDP-glycerol glycerophosphotransferase, partial [Streptomyces sp. Ncost-T6T-2b]
MTATQDELFAALAELKKSDTRYADRRRSFAEKFGAVRPGRRGPRHR